MDAMNHNESNEHSVQEWLSLVGYSPPTTTVLLSIKERPKTCDDPLVVCEYGVCLVDCPTGTVMVNLHFFSMREDCLELYPRL